MGRAWAGQAQPLQPRGRGPAESCWGSEEKAACPDVGELLAWMGTWGTDLPRTPLRCPLPARRRRLGVRTVSLAGTLVWGPAGQEGRGGGTDPVRPPAPSPILLLTRGGGACAVRRHTACWSWTPSCRASLGPGVLCHPEVLGGLPRPSPRLLVPAGCWVRLCRAARWAGSALVLAGWSFQPACAMWAARPRRCRAVRARVVLGGAGNPLIRGQETESRG